MLIVVMLSVAAQSVIRSVVTLNVVAYNEFLKGGAPSDDVALLNWFKNLFENWFRMTHFRFIIVILSLVPWAT
jgi:hypothetical protein